MTMGPVFVIVNAMKKIFDRFVLFLNGVALLLCGVALVDFLLHPLAVDMNFNSSIYRAASVLLLMPLTLLVGFLVIRRVPGNIVGPLLIVWSGTVAFFSIHEGIGAVPIAIFLYYDIAFGWLGLFLMVAHFPDGPDLPAWRSPLGLPPAGDHADRLSPRLPEHPHLAGAISDGESFPPPCIGEGFRANHRHSAPAALFHPGAVRALTGAALP